SGAVQSIAQRGNALEARVQGSEYSPYIVRVQFDASSPTEASCTCPYDFGGWCKHIVAALLVCLRRPGDVEERPPLAELLAPLDRDQLRDLLLALAAGDPDLADSIEAQLAVQSMRSGRTAISSNVDVKALRRRVRSLFAAGFDDYRAAYSAADGIYK